MNSTKQTNDNWWGNEMRLTQFFHSISFPTLPGWLKKVSDSLAGELHVHISNDYWRNVESSKLNYFWFNIYCILSDYWSIFIIKHIQCIARAKEIYCFFRWIAELLFRDLVINLTRTSRSWSLPMPASF